MCTSIYAKDCMSMYVNIYVCMHVCMYACMHSVHICTYAYVRMHMYVYVYANFHECMWTPSCSTPLALDNCRQIHLWRVRGFPLRCTREGW